MEIIRRLRDYAVADSICLIIMLVPCINELLSRPSNTLEPSQFLIIVYLFLIFIIYYA